jgi:hypothetical protein
MVKSKFDLDTWFGRYKYFYFESLFARNPINTCNTTLRMCVTSSTAACTSKRSPLGLSMHESDVWAAVCARQACAGPSVTDRQTVMRVTYNIIILATQMAACFFFRIQALSIVAKSVYVLLKR